MATVSTRTGVHSFEDFCWIVEDGQKADLIDGTIQKVTVLRLDGKGKYRDIRPRKGRFHSLVINGFWLDASWLWQRPLPDLLEVLRLIRGPA